MKSFNIHKDVVVLENNALAAEQTRIAALNSKKETQDSEKDGSDKAPKKTRAKKEDA